MLLLSRAVSLDLYVFCAYAQTAFLASNQNSAIAITFSDVDFLKENNNLAIRRRYHAVTSTFDI